MKFIQLTDLHLVANGETLYGLDPVERLEACIADLNARHSDAALVVVTGDLAHAGDEAAYRVLERLLGTLELPCHLLIGNHDDRQAFQRVFDRAPRDADGFVQFVVETEAGLLVALDTNDSDHHHGVLCERRLGWLQGVLDEASRQPVYLFMHHPPFAVGLKRMDAIALRDRERFAEVVCGRDNLRHLFFGHVHRPMGGSWRGIPFTNMPGMNHQVALDFEIEDRIPGSHEPPAYAVVLAQPDATLVHLHSFLDRTGTFFL